MEPFLLFIIAFFIALAVQLWFALWWLGLRYFRPMRRLAHTIELFAQGNWDQRAALKRKDELGNLAGTFNYAADRLQEAHESDERRLRSVSELAHLAATAPSLEAFLARSQALLEKDYEPLRVSICPAWLPEPPAGEPGRPDEEPDASLPVAMQGETLAALNVYANAEVGLSRADLGDLRLAAEQLGPALQSFRLHAARAGLESGARLGDAARQIACAESAEQIYQALSRAFATAAFPALLMQCKADGLLVVAGPEGKHDLPAWLDLPRAELESRLSPENAYLLSPAAGGPGLPQALLDLLPRLGCASAAWLPTWREGRPALLLALGAAAADPQRAFTPFTLQPYIHLVELATTALEKVQARQALRQLQEDNQRQAERERMLEEIGRQIRSSVDLQGILQTTATALGSALGARKTSIRVQLEETSQPDEP